MDREATTNDNDAIDADMHARGGDAELIPWLSWSQIVHHTFHFASDTEAEMLCAPVYDTDCLQPLKQTHGCSLWSSGNRWCR